MSSSAALAKPSIVPAVSLDRGSYRNFLSDVVIEHGPRNLLGRLFLQADTTLRSKGINVSFASIDELVAANRANAESWRPILPLFDPAVSDIDDDNAHVMLGRNANGEVVCAHGCRMFDLGQVTLKEEIESLRLFYRDPDASRMPGEEMRVSAPVAAETMGRVLFTGAAWYRPDFRKLGVMPTLSILNRAVFHTRWEPEMSFSFMAPELVKAGVAKACQMHRVENEVTMINTPVLRDGTINAALIWADIEDTLDVFSGFVRAPSTGGDAQVDGMVDDGTADKKVAG